MKKLLFLIPALLIPVTAIAAKSGPDPVYVKLETGDGNVFLELNTAKAPKTVANFVQYVEDGHYDGTIFHRVIPGFVAQGGGYDKALKERETREPIENESKNGLSNTRGTIAMARTNDPHSATAQWYINLADNPRLDGKDYKWGYAVFGKVVSGMDVLDEIAKIPTGPAGQFESDVPFRPVVVRKAEVIEKLPEETKKQAEEKAPAAK